MFNVFSDPELRARQDTLDAQWNGLWGTYNATCTNGLGNAFPEFATDYKAWKDFYNSESDYTSASKHATDEFQTKAQEWSKRLKDYGCGDSSLGNDLGIPGVKDNPADRPGFIDEIESSVKTYATGLGVSVLLILAAIVAVIYFISKSNIGSNIGVSV